jgi:3-oxoadipate enol-lactonase
MNVTQANVAGADIVQAGEGPDLLLLHSLLAERSVFDRALPDLASDYRVTLPNLPGYGGTPPLDMESPSVADYADRIAGMMDSLDLPPDTAVLGNGAGGFMAVALAIRHGDRIGELVLADTGPGFPDPAKAPCSRRGHVADVSRTLYRSPSRNYRRTQSCSRGVPA